MTLFKRALNWLILSIGIVAGLAASAAVFIARYMINPPRQRLWATPGDLGLSFEDAEIWTSDGVELSGWFVHAPVESTRNGATILLLHGWLWNRLGEASEHTLAQISQATPVDLLRLAYGLHQEGYNTLMLDMRNHGDSESVPPTTFGWKEANDVLGALDYLEKRSDVAVERIGAVGFSAGANALLYALPNTNRISAAVAVQPVSASLFARRFGWHLLGPLSKLALPLTELIYRAYGGPPLSGIKPGFAAASSGSTPILFIQGKGDPWGSVTDVSHMAEASTQSLGPLVVESDDRYGGYQYPIDNPKVLTAFFEQHMPE